MKRILFTTAMFLIAIICFSQTNEKTFIYCELLGHSKLMSTKCTVEIDYGQYKFEKIKNEKGKNQAFNSMVDAMNYMGSLGWEFVQAYVITEGGNQNVYHWLLKKEANTEELESLKELTNKNK
jgi:hypothetical protein